MGKPNRGKMLMTFESIVLKRAEDVYSWYYHNNLLTTVCCTTTAVTCRKQCSNGCRGTIVLLPKETLHYFFINWTVVENK